VIGRFGASLVDTIYPPRCLACTEATDTPHGLCPTCWKDTDFISSSACRSCGLPLLGAASPEDICDACRRHPPAWDRGAAALLYRGSGRRMVLAFKHGDRLDMTRTLAHWMSGRGGDLLAETDLVAPVPLHWRRLLRRRYNQSAELAKMLGAACRKPIGVDLLKRSRWTGSQEGRNRTERLANQAAAFTVSPRHRAGLAGKNVLLIDDVLTTGATLSSCAEALRAAAAARIDILVLARVAFEDSLHI